MPKESLSYMKGERIIVLQDLEFTQHLQQAGYQPLLLSPEGAFDFFQSKDAELLVEAHSGANQGFLFALGLVPTLRVLMQNLIKLFVKGPMLFPSRLAAMQIVTQEIEEGSFKEKSLSQTKELEEKTFLTLAQISKSLEDRSNYFAGHGKKLEEIAVAMGQLLELHQENLKSLQQACTLHDLGVINIPLEILLKAEPLTPDEKALLQNHAIMARKILSTFHALNKVSSILMAHHEWYNGDGYPTGLKGSEIPLEAQILSLAETYTSLTSVHPYQQALSHEEAIKILNKASQTQFNPDLIKLLPEALSKKSPMKNEYLKPPSHLGIPALIALFCIKEDYTKAVELWEKSNHVLTPKSSVKILTDIWGSQALWALGHLQGIEKAKRALVDAYETNDSLLLGHAILNLALLELSRRRLDECADLFPLALDLLEQEEDYYASALTMWGLSKLEYSLEKQKENLGDSFERSMEKFLFFVERLGLEDFMICHDSETLPLLTESLRLGIRQNTVRHILKQIGMKTKGGLYSQDLLLLLGDQTIASAAAASHQKASADPQNFNLFIRCFGEFEVFQSGVKVQEEEWITRKVRSIFAFLISHLDQPILEEKLMDLFWPDADTDKARHTLHTTIYRLRRTLEPGLEKGTQSKYIHHKGNTYRFNPDASCWLDLEEFERLVKRGQLLENQGDLPQAKREYQMAVSLYGGSFIPEYDEAWCIPIREKYRRLFIRTLSSLIQWAMKSQNSNEVIALSQQILKEDPASEWAHQKLMQAFLAIGKRDEAIRQYQACSELLKKNLNIQPSEETLKLYQLIQQS